MHCPRHWNISEQTCFELAGSRNIADWIRAARTFFGVTPEEASLDVVTTPDIRPKRRLIRGTSIDPAGVILDAADELIMGLCPVDGESLASIDDPRSAALAELFDYLGRKNLYHGTTDAPRSGYLLRLSRAPTFEAWLWLWRDHAGQEDRPDEMRARAAEACRELLASTLQRIVLEEERDAGAMTALEQLVLTLEAKDPYTRGHAERVGMYSEAMVELLRHGARPEALADEASASALRQAGRLHDLGKVFIATKTLNKPGALDRFEREEIVRHPLLARDLLAANTLASGFLSWVEAHHERWDGKGYPRGLSREEIPLQARILAICDVFDAVTSDRSYREAMADDHALAILRRDRGAAFDPQLVDAFEQLYSEGAVHRVRTQWNVDVENLRDGVRWAREGLARPDPTEAVAAARVAHNRLEMLLTLGRLLGSGDKAERREALACLDDAARQAPRDPRPSLARGVILEGQRLRGKEARETLNRALELSLASGSLREEAMTRHILANLDRQEGELDRAHQGLREARRLCVMLGERAREAQVLDTEANVSLWSGDLDEAEAKFKASELLKVRLGDRLGQAITLGNRARAQVFRGTESAFAEANKLFQMDLDLALVLEDRRGEVASLVGLGLTELQRRNRDAALSHYQQARLRAKEAGNIWGELYAVAGLIQVHLSWNEPEAAELLLEEVDRPVSTVQGTQPAILLRVLRAAHAAKTGLLAPAEAVAVLTGLRLQLLALGPMTRYDCAVTLMIIAQLHEVHGVELDPEIAKTLAYESTGELLTARILRPPFKIMLV